MIQFVSVHVREPALMYAHTFMCIYSMYVRMYTPPRIQYVSKLLSVQYWGVACTYTVFVCPLCAHCVYCMQYVQYTHMYVGTTV